MTDPDRTTGATLLARTLLGSIVVSLTAPTGVGPVAGGWVAGRRTRHPSRGAVAASIAGLVGALPWTALAYLASATDPDASTVDPVERLRERYAEGDIDEAEFERRPDALLETEGVDAETARERLRGLECEHERERETEYERNE